MWDLLLVGGLGRESGSLDRIGVEGGERSFLSQVASSSFHNGRCRARLEIEDCTDGPGSIAIKGHWKKQVYRQ